MPDENELEELTDRFLNDTMPMKGDGINGRKAKSPEIVGVMGECCGADCVPCKNIREN